MATLVKGRMVYGLQIGGKYKNPPVSGHYGIERKSGRWSVRNFLQEQERLKEVGDRAFSCKDSHSYATEAAAIEARDLQLRFLGLVVRTTHQGKWRLDVIV